MIKTADKFFDDVDYVSIISTVKGIFTSDGSMAVLLDYEGPKKNIQILKCGIGEEVYEMYPELKEKRVGLGVTNIVLEYLDNLNRFEFTEDKDGLIVVQEFINHFYQSWHFLFNKEPLEFWHMTDRRFLNFPLTKYFPE